MSTNTNNNGNLGKNTFVQFIADGIDLGVFNSLTDISDSSTKEPVKEHYLGHQNASNIPDTSRDLTGSCVIVDKQDNVFRDFYKDKILKQGLEDPYPNITIIIRDIDRYSGSWRTDTYTNCILKSKEISRKGDEVKKHNISWIAGDIE